jgi:hypothetical protein
MAHDNTGEETQSNIPTYLGRSDVEDFEGKRI